MPIEFVKDSWPGSVRSVTIGATPEEGGTRARSVTVGGEKALPFMHFEAEMQYQPAVAVEIKDRRPEDWSPLLLETWGEVMNDPGAWAKAEWGSSTRRMTHDCAARLRSSSFGRTPRYRPVHPWHGVGCFGRLGRSLRSPIPTYCPSTTSVCTTMACFSRWSSSTGSRCVNGSRALHIRPTQPWPS